MKAAVSAAARALIQLQRHLPAPGLLVRGLGFRVGGCKVWGSAEFRDFGFQVSGFRVCIGTPKSINIINSTYTWPQSLQTVQITPRRFQKSKTSISTTYNWPQSQ